MTALRRRMLEDMQVRNLSAGTQQVYLQHISRFARYCGRSPAVLGPEEIRAYQLHLTNEKQLTPATLVIVVLGAALPLSGHAAQDVVDRGRHPRAEETADVTGPCSARPKWCACLTAWKNLKHRTILTTCYARRSPDLGSRAVDRAQRLTAQRMVLRIVQGKGQRDRYVMLSPKLLAILRDWWRVSHPQHWLFPGQASGAPDE